MKHSSEIRQAFLDYFAQHEHEVVPSSSLVPSNDPSLLFTNAGMVQFKDVFLGRETRTPPRAVSSQRCLRAGGKHNDLENVGYTRRHHTFFEMLGNFSFGDYFKEEAIHYCWEFLTGTLALPSERLWVSVYQDDDEAERIWREHIGVAPERVVRLGAEENFWSMGDTGPCGPCSEVYWDHGDSLPGEPLGQGDGGDRFVEIWNLVFMQYRREADGSMEPLPKPSVDTGMGLERISAVLQGVHDNYDTDLFAPVLKVAGALVPDPQPASLNVIADHIRASCFLMVDGVTPSNEGRGYVLRRIIRRALRHGSKMGINEPFFYRLAAPLASVMGEAYPELVREQERIETTLQQEEERFAQTLQAGLKVLDDGLAQMKGRTISGELAFLLYDTYGFPVDLTQDIARERDLTVDLKNYEQLMDEQRDRARETAQFSVDYTLLKNVTQDGRFCGYERLGQDSAVVALYAEGRDVQAIEAPADAVVVLEETPFYAESGGQMGDSGWLQGAQGNFEVGDTQKHGNAHLHIGRLREGRLQIGDTVAAQVDVQRRESLMLNHSATHLMHAALREVLGTHVTQKGSLVAPDRLRFDFSHPQPVTPDELHQVEERVNAVVRQNDSVEAEIMSHAQAMEAGALAFFGEKYGDEVRVLRMGDFSMELCGGTHVQRTGDIGYFCIVSESGVAAGVRRIEALTGALAHRRALEQQTMLAQAASLIRATPDNFQEKLERWVERHQQLEKELERLKSRQAQWVGGELEQQAVEIDGIKVLGAQVDADIKSMRNMLDQLKEKLGSAAIVLASTKAGKVTLVAGVTSDQTERIRAGELVQAVAVQIGGKGGGRADMAQAGGGDPQALPEALNSVPEWVRGQL